MVRLVTSLGQLEFESVEQLLAYQQGQQSPRSSRKSKTPMTLLSRKIALWYQAATTGTWTSGAPVDKSIYIGKLQEINKKLTDEEYAQLTIQAKERLNAFTMGRK